MTRARRWKTSSDVFLNASKWPRAVICSWESHRSYMLLHNVMLYAFFFFFFNTNLLAPSFLTMLTFGTLDVPIITSYRLPYLSDLELSTVSTPTLLRPDFQNFLFGLNKIICICISYLCWSLHQSVLSRSTLNHGLLYLHLHFFIQ